MDDPERLAALDRSRLLSGEDDAGIDRLVRIARRALGTPTVMFSAVAADRQVFVSEIGLPDAWSAAGQTPLSHSFCKIVVEQDAPLVITDASNDARVASNPAIEEANIGAYLGVPVRSVDGYVLGSLCAIDNSRNAWDDGEVDVLTDIAASVEAELKLRRASVDLGDQLQREQVHRDFEESMMSLATATNDAWTIDDVVASVLKHGRASVGAQLVSFAVLDGESLRFSHGEGVTDSVAAEWASAPLDSEVPMALALRVGRPVVLPHPARFGEWPDFEATSTELGFRSFAAVPIGTIHSDYRAVVGIGWADPMATDVLPVDVHRLVSIIGKGLDRAYSHERARAHASLFESMVLPGGLPLVPSLDLHGMYLPPTSSQRVGGDVYDVVVRSDGRVALLLGDATGHDLRASKAALRLRHAVGMLSLERRSPAEVLGAVNNYLRQSSNDLLVTCCYAVVDTTEGTVTIANAGHPRPMLISPLGAVEPIGPWGQPLLGFDDYDYTQETIEFSDQQTLVLYSDGLIERRGVPMATGERWLEGFLGSAAPGSAAELASLLGENMPPERHDDVAVLVARRGQPALSVDGAALVRMWVAGSLDLGEARAAIIEWLATRQDASLFPVDDVLLVASELLTNAREAAIAVGGADTDVELVVRLGEAQLELRVENEGEGFVAVTAMPNDETVRGRGLPLSAALADVSVTTTGARVAVSARFAEPTGGRDPG